MNDYTIFANTMTTSTSSKIITILEEIKSLLLEKNQKYGDSATNPLRVFSKSDTVEQIKVRIDDKLSRIARGCGLLEADEDVINDLIGYLVLLKIAIGNNTDEPWDGSTIDGPWGNARDEEKPKAKRFNPGEYRLLENPNRV